MRDHITKYQRQLDMIAYLIGRRIPVTVDQLMDDLPAYRLPDDATDTEHASVRRTFERDKDDLRAFGIAFDSVPFTVEGQPATGYLLPTADFYLPYLKLLEAAEGEGAEGLEGAESEDHPPGAAPGPHQAGAPPPVELAGTDARDALHGLARAAELPAFPLAREARSAFRKLSFDLSTEGEPPRAVLHPDRPELESQREDLRLLSEALERRKRVAFTYHGIHRHRATKRDVAPWGLFFQGGHWYLVGHDAARDDRRIFRLARMSDQTVQSPGTRGPDYEIPEDFRAESMLDRQPWELGGGDEDPLVAHVRFEFPRSLWAERNQLGEESDKAGDGSQIRAFQLTQIYPFLRWVLSLGGDAEIVDPPELRAELGELARSVAELYG